jgi:hypothetical protein
MTPKELRAAIGLPESATDDEVKERLKVLHAGTETPPPPPPPQPDQPEEDGDEEDDDGDQEVEQPPEGDPAPAGAPPETATVDAAAFRQLQEDARLGREAREQQIAARRKSKVTAAIQAGKVPPARRAAYEKLMAADEDGTTTLLAGLEENVIPVESRGKTTVAADVAATSDDYPLQWLSPGERARVLAARAQEVTS